MHFLDARTVFLHETELHLSKSCKSGVRPVGGRIFCFVNNHKNFRLLPFCHTKIEWWQQMSSSRMYHNNSPRDSQAGLWEEWFDILCRAIAFKSRSASVQTWPLYIVRSSTCNQVNCNLIVFPATPRVQRHHHIAAAWSRETEAVAACSQTGYKLEPDRALSIFHRTISQDQLDDFWIQPLCLGNKYLPLMYIIFLVKIRLSCCLIFICHLPFVIMNSCYLFLAI